MDACSMQIVQQELDPREKLLWPGRPKQGLNTDGNEITFNAKGLLRQAEMKLDCMK
jgi:hypothetical protein